VSLSPIALEALRAAQSAFNKPEADVFEDALARGVEALDREGRLVGAFAAAELARLESLLNAQPATLSEAQIEALAAAANRAVNDATHEDLCACDAWPQKCLSSGGFFQGYWDMGGLSTAIPALIGQWELMRADAAAEELGRLRAQVDEVERKYTFDTAELKRKHDAALARVAELERRVAAEECRCPEPAPLCQGCRCRCHAEHVRESADKLTQLLAPAPALHDDEEAAE
jgi:hypothetical protein